MKVGLLLGSFDPPHIGHVMMASYALDHGMDMVWVVPCWGNPTKSNQTKFTYRSSMCFETFKGIPNTEVISDDTSIKSVNTYDYLTKSIYYKNKDNEFSIIVGSDIDVSTWFNGKWILENFPIIHVPRLGVRYDVPLGIKCSSTDLRTMIKDGKNPFPFLNQKVIEYIKQHKLYD